MGHLGPRLEINWKIIPSHIRKKTIYTYLPRYASTSPYHHPTLPNFSRKADGAGLSRGCLMAGGRGSLRTPSRHSVAVSPCGQGYRPQPSMHSGQRHWVLWALGIWDKSPGLKTLSFLLPPSTQVCHFCLAPSLGCLALFQVRPHSPLPGVCFQADASCSLHLAEVWRWGLGHKG